MRLVTTRVSELVLLRRLREAVRVQALRHAQRLSWSFVLGLRRGHLSEQTISAPVQSAGQ